MDCEWLEFAAMRTISAITDKDKGDQWQRRAIIRGATIVVDIRKDSGLTVAVGLIVESN